jgi:bifunctional non-homologous end joining protein LigD
MTEIDFRPQLLYCPSWYSSPTPPLDDFDAAEWVMDVKLDGWRFVFHITPAGTVEAYGRNGGRYAYNLPTTLTDALLATFPPDTVVDTEVCAVGEGMQSTDVSTVLANHRAGELRAYVFDITRRNGFDLRQLPWAARRELLLNAPGWSTADYPCLAPTIVTEPSLDVFKRWTELGLEGCALKRKSAPYRSGAKHRDWIKAKPQKTMDCRIVGFSMSEEGKYAGMIGAVEFEIEPGKIGRASGMIDAVRQDMTDHPECYIDRIAEFAYNCRTKDGFLRHPQYRRLRPDLELVS